MIDVLADVKRALEATDAEHHAAIASTVCVICGAKPGAECTYGAGNGRPSGQHFPGRVHTRRMRRYLASISVDTNSDP